MGNASLLASEALARARGNQATSNYAAIYAGFAKKGIPECDILPRENVLTFWAWKALGRRVLKGEHGVRVTTWIPIKERRDATTGELTHKAGRRPKVATVFHISQTTEIK